MRYYYFAVLLIATGGCLVAQPRAVSGSASAPGVIDIQDLWPSGVPFTAANVKSWAMAELEHNRGRYVFLRVTTGPDKREIASALGGRIPDLGAYAWDNEAKYPIAQLTASDGEASLMMQPGNGYASEEIIRGSRSPLLMESSGKRYRILHVDASHYGYGIPAIVFLQSEQQETDAESGASLWRQLSKRLKVSKMRIVIRPDSWFENEEYPFLYRFILDFGQKYFAKPLAPRSRWFYRQPEMECRDQEPGYVTCDKMSVLYENRKLPR